ncbi:hypothetical protein PN836_001630 [Ningiella sp. W23]|uniref:hypothetical protein n=1 Tax=Ningiella sp. W23 TaxID=3023715 RepID=UPI0037575FE0
MYAKSIDHNIDIDESCNTRQPVKKRTRTSIPIVIASVLLHTLVIYVIFAVHKHHKQLQLPEDKNSKALNSYLIIRAPKVAEPETKTLPIELSQASNQRLSELETAEKPLDAAAEERASDAIDATANLIEQVEAEPAESNSNLEILTNKSDVSSAEMAKLKLKNIHSAAEQFFQQQEQSAVSKMAGEASRKFQEEKNQVLIDTSPKMSVEEREALLRKIEVDCTNAKKKGMMIIMGVLGGTVECRSHSNFQEYIDKHLNKESRR